MIGKMGRKSLEFFLNITFVENGMQRRKHSDQALVQQEYLHAFQLAQQQQVRALI